MKAAPSEAAQAKKVRPPRALDGKTDEHKASRFIEQRQRNNNNATQEAPQVSQGALQVNNCAQTKEFMKSQPAKRLEQQQQQQGQLLAANKARCKEQELIPKANVKSLISRFS